MNAIEFKSQSSVPIQYKGLSLDAELGMMFLVEDAMSVELNQ